MCVTIYDIEYITGDYYSEIDSLGRCGVAYAMLERTLMPTEERGSIGQVKPSGWNQEKYPGIVDSEPPYLYNRCHLIAYSLSAADKDLSGVDIVSVANAMYEPANEPTSDIPDDEAGSGEEHVMQTDIAGCDTFTQIVDKLTDGSGYTNAQVDGTDVLLVASGTFDNGGGSMAAIDAEVFSYKDGAPAYMGYVASGEPRILWL